MKHFVGGIVALILILISILHIYWAFGGKAFADNVLPELPETNNKKVFIPGFFATFLVAILLLMAASIILVKSDLITFTQFPLIFNLGIWILFVVFTLRSIGDFKYVGFFKKIYGTNFALMDTKFYSPLCLLLAFMTFIIII